MTTSPESPLIPIFEGLLSGALSRAEAGQAAAAATLTGSRWYDHGALGALSVLDVVVPEHHSRDDPPWFINDQALRDWLVLLRGGELHRDLPEGWRRCALQDHPKKGSPQALSTVIGGFPERPSGALHRTLGQALRTHNDLATYESWYLISPQGGVTYINRFCCFEHERIRSNPEMSFTVCSSGDVDPASLLTALDALIDVKPTLEQRRRYSLSLDWALWRQDDNGNEFRISRHLSEAGAERAQRWMSSFHHKQTYWTQHEPR